MPKNSYKFSVNIEISLNDASTSPIIYWSLEKAYQFGHVCDEPLTRFEDKISLFEPIDLIDDVWAKIRKSID